MYVLDSDHSRPMATTAGKKELLLEALQCGVWQFINTKS